MSKLNSPRGFAPEMTRAQHHRYGLATRWLADQMGLRDWQIDVSYAAEEDETAMATCQIPRDRKVAIVSLAPYWEDIPILEKLQTLMHELLHCHLDPMEGTIEDTIRRIASPSVMEISSELINHHVEMIVDNLSMAWSASVSMNEFKKILSGKE